MNDFQAWAKIIEEWKQVDKMKRMSQELYDLLASSVLYILEYAKRNDIILPHKERMYGMLDNIDDKIADVRSFHERINSSDEYLQGDKKGRNPTETGQNSCSQKTKISLVISLVI